jgi:hypothetical protein
MCWSNFELCPLGTIVIRGVRSLGEGYGSSQRGTVGTRQVRWLSVGTAVMRGVRWVAGGCGVYQRGRVVMRGVRWLAERYGV